LKVEVDLNGGVRVDGNGRVDAVVSGQLNGDQQQVELDETEPAERHAADPLSPSNIDFTIGYDKVMYNVR